MKRICTIIICSLLFISSVSAIKNNFKVDIKNILNKDSRTVKITEQLDNKFAIDYESISKDEETTNMEQLTRKITYLILGDGNNEDESSSEYLQRKEDFLKYMYQPKIPTNSEGKYDTDSEEYKDNSFSGYVIPNMFRLLNDINVRYSYLGNVKVVKQDKGFISQIIINDANLLVSDKVNPKKYIDQKANIVLYYIFKEYEGNYYLYYCFGETNDEVNDYINKNKQEENKGILSSKTPNITDFSNVYDYSKLYALTDKELLKIYNSNIDKTMLLNTYYDKSIIDAATGFMLTKDVVVTSWEYLKNSLINGQYIEVKDYKNNLYPVEGIININEDADIALIKIKGYKKFGVIIGDSSKLSSEDPVISLGSKTGSGITSSTGIIMSIDTNIQSLIPITNFDRGGPLLNSSGEVIGINNSLSINSSVSYATKIDILKDLQNKLNDNDITYTSFDKLKEYYYYQKNNEEIVKNEIPNKVWNKLSKVGNIEEIMYLPLVKASYKNNILSLRYKNEVNLVLPSTNLENNLVQNLKKNNYKEILNSSNKKIYENNEYKVIIMNEFNYLIVVMVIK